MRANRLCVWKNYGRHPLSNDYPDLDDVAAERMLAGVKKHRILAGRKIVLYEGQVLDGWQLYQACKKAGVRPQFQKLRTGITPEEYVELVNDTRRHETRETMAARAVARRERVAEAKRTGKSNVQIADDEGVAESTIRNDVKALRSQGANVDSPNGEITDSQGRKQPAAKSKIIPQLQELIDAGKISPKRVPEIESLDRNQQGVVFERIKAGDNPRTAIDKALAPPREPGDEVPTKRTARNGQPAFDVKEFRTLVGHVYAQVHKVQMIYGLKDSPEGKALEQGLTEWGTTFEQWVAAVKKQPA